MTEPDTSTLGGEDSAAQSERVAFELMHAGVPLTLLLDLAEAVPSEELMHDEPADTSWVPRGPG